MVIYETINKINGKRYIGKDKNDDCNYLGSGKFLQKAIEKYGRKNFIKTILERCTSDEELNEREQHWISITNAQKSKLYYNIAPGGDGGDNWLNRKDTVEYKQFKEKMKVIRATKINNKHAESTKETMRKVAVGRYTLPWFILKYGEDIGTEKYYKRKHFLSVRYLSPEQVIALTLLTKEKIIELLQSKYTQTQIIDEYNISHKWLYKKYSEYFGTKNLIKIKKQFQTCG